DRTRPAQASAYLRDVREPGYSSHGLAWHVIALPAVAERVAPAIAPAPHGAVGLPCARVHDAGRDAGDLGERDMAATEHTLVVGAPAVRGRVGHARARVQVAHRELRDAVRGWRAVLDRSRTLDARVGVEHAAEALVARGVGDRFAARAGAG